MATKINISTSTPNFDFTPNVDHLLLEKEYRIYDTLLAGTLTLCTVIGLPGNLVSLIYFYSASRRDFSSLIYTIVCSIDICTCVVHTPVMIALYNSRRPGIFSEKTFCVTWIVVFNYVQKVSMFLVMLLSVARTVTMIFLRYKIKKRFLLAAFLAYTAFLMVWNFFIYAFGGSNKWYGYYEFDVYCYFALYSKPFSYICQLIEAICVSLPPIVTSVSFTVFAYKLLRKDHVSRMNRRKHQAAVTMAMFTALFLTCNLPCLMNYFLWFLNSLIYNNAYPGPIYSSPFMAYYSWLISNIVCTVLNASLNPVLYFCRMEHVRFWVSSRGSDQRTGNRPHHVT